MSKLQKLIEKENWLLDLADSVNDFKDIQLAFDKKYGNAGRNKIFEFKRKLTLDLEKILHRNGGLLPEEELVLIMFKYVKFNNSWILKSDLKKSESQLKLKLKQKGYLSSDNFELSKIHSDSIYFSRSVDILKYFFLEFGIEVIRINQELIDKLNIAFSANIKSLRAFLSNLERYDFLRKVGTGAFVRRKNNEEEIANRMTKIISDIDFNFLTKEKIEIIVESVISDEGLLLDEFYYILRDNNIGNFHFSTGNSMYIAKSKKMADKTGEERICDLIKKDPVILTTEEMAFKLGFGKNVYANFQYVYIAGDNFLFFDKNNSNNVKFMQKIFKGFLKYKEGMLFYTPEIRDYLDKYGTNFTERLSKNHSFSSLLPEIYEDVKYDTKTKAYTYKIGSEQILDLDNWENF